MNITQVVCSSCAGMGHTTKLKVVSEGVMERIDDIVCEACNGKGYTEYATFTLEEAKAILEHCGLSTKS